MSKEIQKLIDMATKQASEKAKSHSPNNVAKALAALANEPMDATKEAFVRKYHIKNIKYKRPEQLIVDVHKALDKLDNSLSVEERNILLMKFLKEWRDANVSQ